MRRNIKSMPPVIIAVLILQIVPLLLFPAKSFLSTTQEWWLPALLVLMVLIADFQLIIRRSPAAAPWYLMSFAQGFNIISRLMMLWPNISRTSEQGIFVNWTYVIFTFAAMLLSAWLLWYTEKPDVRVGLLRV